MSERKYIRVAEFQKIYGICQAKAYRLTKREDFPCTKIGATILIDREKLESEWIPKHKNDY